jgi:hypothetical protein
MDNLNQQKKSWTKPSVHLLIIKKDTFGGSSLEAETKGAGMPNVPSDPTPR